MLAEREKAEEELKKAKEKAEESEKQSANRLIFINNLIDNIPIPLFYKDKNGKYIGCNPAFEGFVGRNKNEIINKTVFELWGTEESKVYHEKDMELLSKGGFQSYEYIVKNAHGEQREVIFNKSVFYEDNQIAGIIGTYFDVTEKHKLEDSLQKTQKLESLGLLAGGIAHDFNNILSAIFGFTELAMLKTSESKISAYLNKSLNNVERARALTQQLLTFAKGGAPVKKVEKLFPFIEETVKFALSGSSVSSKFQIEDNLWACNIDKNQIGQVIDNLAINARQAMSDGGTIEVHAKNITLSEEEHGTLASGNYVKLSIKDQGVGISKEFLLRIFDPYYTTKATGHGLGLATCYSIVTRHDGVIDVESESGKGSTFSIYLPATVDTISTKVKKSLVGHTGSGTFLVMDDEETILDLMKDMLESFGYNVVIKTNGKDALDFFETEVKADRKIAGMIFDLTIPGGMGGKEAINEIRKICSDTPVFVSSGYSADPIISNPEEYGFTASISKPFRITDLSQMLEKYGKN